MSEMTIGAERGTLLVATRDEGVRDALDGLESRLHLSAGIVDSGRELLDRLQEGVWEPEGVKLILLDDDLPDVAGRSLVCRIREIDPDRKILFVAGEVVPAMEIGVRREGIFFFFHKPLDRDLLSRVLARALEHESSRRYLRRVV